MDWFRCYSEFATDAKVQIMPEHMQRRLIMLFCLRCSNALATLHETELCFALRISEQELQETKELFIKKDFIDDAWNILSWDRRQYISDTSTERSRRHREKKRSNMQRPCNVAATPPEQNRTEHNIADTEQKKRVKAVALPLPDWLPLNEWNGFLEVRKKKNKVPTDLAIQMLIVKLDELRKKGHDPAAVIDQSIINSWSGFFEIKGDYNGNNNKKPSVHDDFTRGIELALSEFNQEQ